MSLIFSLFPSAVKGSLILSFLGLLSVYPLPLTVYLDVFVLKRIINLSFKTLTLFLIGLGI